MQVLNLLLKFKQYIVNVEQLILWDKKLIVEDIYKKHLELIFQMLMHKYLLIKIMKYLLKLYMIEDGLLQIN